MDDVTREIELRGHDSIDKKLEPKALPAIGRAPGAALPIAYSLTQVRQVPLQVLRKNRVLVGTENLEVMGAYNMLRTQVLQRMTAKRWNALAITSPGPGQGKTLTAVNLAISLARGVHYTVLLADFDLRHPTVHRYFGLAPARGISDYLLHDTPLPEILINPSMERLVLLPGREPLFNSSEMLAAPKMEQLVAELKTRYPSRLVLFDLPPLLSSDDALAFSPYVDAVLLVVQEGKTTKDELQRALSLLQSPPIIGTVLNKSEDAISTYY